MDKQTPLYALHELYGGKMTRFAGHALPLFYKGILAEHTHTRTQASLFDISHMGQLELRVAPSVLEQVCPSDLENLKVGQMRYTVLLNPQGGICDDVIVTRTSDGFLLVVNGACVKKDISLLQNLGAKVKRHTRALLALQGPRAAAVLKKHVPEAPALGFMTSLEVNFGTVRCRLSRCGYTGEDGYELSVLATQAEKLAQKLLEQKSVALAGLGARDSLRLEAGLCLYGQDINDTTTPTEAGLGWIIPERRRKNKDFAGARKKPKKMRVGFLAEGKIPPRAGAEILLPTNTTVGHITSGGFSPTLGRGIAMGMLHLDTPLNTPFTVRLGFKEQKVQKTSLPFVPHRTHNKAYVSDLLHTTA